MQFSFRIPHFWHPPNFAKTLFWHTVALFVFLEMPKKHYKNGKTVKNKLGPLFNFKLGPLFNFETPKSWTTFNFTAYIYIYIYIYACCCVQFRGAFFSPIGSRMLFFEQVTYENEQQTVSSPGESYPVMRTTAAQCPPGVALQCVQKRGAYVAQHKNPIIERARAGHFWTLQFPLVSRFIPHNLKIPETPIFTAFRDDFVGVFGPPQTEYQNIFSSQEDNCKSAFRKQGWRTFCLQKTILKPLFL